MDSSQVAAVAGIPLTPPAGFDASDLIADYCGATCKAAGVVGSSCSRRLSISAPSAPSGQGRLRRLTQASALFSDQYCRHGSTGALCAVCIAGWRTSPSAGGCVECTASGSTEVADFIPIIIIIACVVALLLAYCVCFRKHVAKRIKGRDMKTTTQRASTKYLEKRDKIVALRTILKESMTKLKIMTGNMQVMQGVKGVFDIQWPSAFKELLSLFTIVDFDFVKLVPLECSLQYDFLDLIVIRTIAPLVVVVLLLLLSLFATRAKMPAMQHVTVNGALVLVFLCYPGVTQVVFRFFQTQEFEGGFGTFLVADYSIDVNGSAYQRMTPFAVIMIFVWPVGVPLFITVLLWRNRRTLLEARRREKIIGTYDGYNNGTWFDHLAKVEAMGGTCDQRDKEELEIGGYLFSLTLNNYRARVFYWEVIEYVLQKLVLVGLLVFFERGSIEQLVLGLIVCFLYYGLVQWLQPFNSKSDNFMAAASQFALFLALLMAVVVRDGSSDVPQSVVSILTLSALGPSVIAFLLIFQLALNEFGYDPLGRAINKVVDILTPRAAQPLPHPPLAASTNPPHSGAMANAANAPGDAARFDA